MSKDNNPPSTPSLENKPIPAASHAAGVVPEGYKLVPIEPTYEMFKAAMMSIQSGETMMSDIYKAMLAAAPEPEKAQGDDVMTDKELRDWIFQWSQNEGKIPLESDINDLIWTIQKQSGRISSAQEPKDEVSPQQRAKQEDIERIVRKHMLDE